MIMQFISQKQVHQYLQYKKTQNTMLEQTQEKQTQ